MITSAILVGSSDAQIVAREAAISAYIYNFAKNIVWQNEEEIQEFRFLVIGNDQEIFRQLTTLSKVKTLKNKPIRVSSFVSASDLDSFQLIFITEDNNVDYIKIFDKVEGKNILLVSDQYQDKRLIMINFFDSEDGTLHFEINKANIINQHLEIMHDMILLGGTEIDVAELYREGQQSLRSLQKYSDDLENKITQLQLATEIKTQEVRAMQDSLKKQVMNVLKQQKVLDQQSVLLKQREKELNDQLHKIEQQERILTMQKQDIASQEKKLEKGYEKLQKQTTEIKLQSKILRKQGLIIHRQRILMILLLIIVLLTAILIITISYNYRQKQRINRELEKRVMERTEALKILNKQLQVELGEKEKAEELLRVSEERYRFLFERNPAPMLIYDPASLKLLAVNEAFCNHYGYPEGEALNMNLPDLYPEEEKKPIIELAQSLHGHAYVGEWHHVKKGGTVFPIIATSHELDYMGHDSRIAVITDITERKRIEQEIQNLNQVLEERVADRTARLSAINKELESYSYSISHDLRAPLRAIFGFSQILSTRHRDSLNEEGRQYMDYIVQASIRMEQLINDLLNYSRLGRKSIELRPVSLNDVLNNVYDDFKQRFDEIGATYKADNELPQIPGDESLLRQIFTNLIENAVTYRRKEKPLEINIGCELVPEGCIIKVADNGIGIPEEHWDKIFNIFQRLHSDDQYPGTGIGLATVRKAIDMLDGKIWVESIVGKGSTFFLQFPLLKT